ncbi:MAG: class I SAM-dependent methyltransferase [Nitrososphaerota archaeon]|nr:class I SAM-dependent methyltransferase [Nitrososphaerota archaeon]MDG6903866.1 class I SAM-dependent methyltransferase [Nitrososphaerota archaeon]MDG6940404.1 class I SAM-dependent methyltransferase [Nitrososphaerota archaeon]MDG6960718.1 class I SAM-dependent methyltransferase [Nitrososphaerota archaeon]MDG6962397.1 class I SAM-dependent methyltransferase [Nitrososphaerota archaeon]
MAALLGWMLISSASALGMFLLWSAFIGAGWQPTSRRKVRKMLEMCRVGPSDVVYDLGSGDGRILVEAAKTYHATAVGVEADPIRVLFSRFAVGTNRLKGRVQVVWGNFFHVDLSEATVVTLFLSQGANRKLKAKLLSELRPGARVVSYVWTFDGWSPASRDADDEISLYVVPSHDVSSPDRAATASFHADGRLA